MEDPPAMIAILPSEMVLEIMDRMDVATLCSFSATCRFYAHLSSQPYIWQQKLSRLTLHNIERLWITPLIANDQDRLLEAFLLQMSDLNRFLDERTIVSVVLRLIWSGAPDRLMMRLMESLPDRRLFQMTGIELVQEITIIRTNMTNLTTQWKEAIANGDMIDFAFTQRTFVDLIGPFGMKERTMVAFNFFSECMGRLLCDVSSTSVLKILAESQRPWVATTCLTILQNLLIPHQVQEAAKGDQTAIESLIEYREAINNYARLLDNLNITSHVDITALRLRDYYDQNVIRYASLGIATILLNDDWSGISGMDEIPFYCHYMDTAQKIAELSCYDPHKLPVGPPAVDGDSWIAWMERLPSEIDRERVTLAAYFSAQIGGYTHFAAIVKQYRERKGWTIEE